MNLYAVSCPKMDFLDYAGLFGIENPPRVLLSNGTLTVMEWHIERELEDVECEFLDSLEEKYKWFSWRVF